MRATDIRRLTYIPGFVHAALVGWLCETAGETRTLRALGWSQCRMGDVLGGVARLRPDERDRLFVVFGSTCSALLDGEELYRE